MGTPLLTFREQYNGTVFPTVGGQWVHPGSKIAAFVRSTGVQDGDDPFIANNLVTTLNAGLARCRSNMNDVVYVLQGHSENVSSATALSSLVAGTRIVGVGDPLRTNAPAFTWTATDAQWAINVANVSIENLNLSPCGANGVVKAINVTGATCSITNCTFTLSTGATLKSAIAVEWGSAATYGRFCGNRIFGLASVDAGIAVKLVGATVPSSFTFTDNVGAAGCTVATGFLNVTVAALDLQIHRNRLYNTLAASTACISFSNVACDGFVTENLLGTKNDGVATAQGLVIGAGALCVFAENYSVDEAKKSAVLTPAAVAT